jgi:ATP-dependent HslUV protease ATP-binding subunit HslU
MDTNTSKESKAIISNGELTPRMIVAELDQYIVGQHEAKRAVAIAIRNRIRRQKLPPEIAVDVLPKNILMIGSTGVGKTEIARRLSRLVNAPFLKVEASKFTEVGYVGRDVESMVRDLTEVSVELTRQIEFENQKSQAELNTEERLLDLLLPGHNFSTDWADSEYESNSSSSTREKLRQKLRDGKLEHRIVEMEIQDKSVPVLEVAGPQGVEEMGFNMRDMLGNLFPGRSRNRRLRVSEAREYIHREEQEKLLDMDKVSRLAIEKVEQSGIIFLDEIDKIAARENAQSGPDVSREGVQRDILPIVEGTTVNTRYGMVKTEHILFIAAGAFHVSKPSDLIPELQGRFPIRVTLESLTVDDLKQILTQPKNSLIKQYQALLSTEDVKLEFSADAIDALAAFAAQINEQTEDIGARRLHTLIEKVLEEISFFGNELDNHHQLIDAEYIRSRIGSLVQDQDRSRYIL